jgi:hypothetical protein
MLDISYHTLQAYLRYYEGGHGPIARQIPAWARPSEDAVQDAGGPQRLRGDVQDPAAQRARVRAEVADAELVE